MHVAETQAVEDELRRKAVGRQHEDRRVRQLIEGALREPRPTPTLDDLVQMMLEHREAALSVERHSVVHGTPDDFRNADNEAAIYKRLRERLGSRHANRFMTLVAHMRADDDGVIRRKNSPPPLDSAHISCRLAATRKSAPSGQEGTCRRLFDARAIQSLRIPSATAELDMLSPS
jgi:hypothetical protein